VIRDALADVAAREDFLRLPALVYRGDPNHNATARADAQAALERPGTVHFLVALADGGPVARLVARLSPALRDGEGRPYGMLGSFEAVEGGEAAVRELFEQATGWLRNAGAGPIIGPMDGDTWHRYRVVSESDGSPPYLLEPVSDPGSHEAFLAAGFAPISHYMSARGLLQDAIAPEAPQIAGITVTRWDGTRSEALFDRLFESSTGAFARNYFFKPITKEAFLKLYEPIIPLIDPRHVLFARDPGGNLVGFLFGIPDRLEGPQPKTVILKTYASGLPGVGHLLADTFHREALALGYAQVIHALMHESNVSLQRSKRYGAHVFRRYALMGRRLK
jgi:hypothetical protein